jgi:hypothetical protein
MKSGTRDDRVFLEKRAMIYYVYRFSLGRWALLCLLFAVSVILGIRYYLERFDPNTLPPTAAGIAQEPSDGDAFPCRNMVYSISEDGVRYVREDGGGTIFAARLNQTVGFYQVNPYGYMLPIDPKTLDGESVGRLSKALLQCEGPWLPSGAWFNLSAKAEEAGPALK